MEIRSETTLSFIASSQAFDSFLLASKMLSSVFLFWVSWRTRDPLIFNPLAPLHTLHIVSSGGPYWKERTMRLSTALAADKLKEG